MNMWDETFAKLKADGFNVYPPGVKRGEITEPYIVLKSGNQSPTLTGNVVGIKIMDVIYFHDTYSQIETYKDQIKTSLSGLNFLKRTGNETSPIPDDSVGAFTGNIEFLVQGRLQ